eukprot:1725841-Amphidinium_carterae.1
MVLPGTPFHAQESQVLPLPVPWADGHEALLQVSHAVGVQPISKSERLCWQSSPIAAKNHQVQGAHEQQCQHWPRYQLGHCHADHQ